MEPQTVQATAQKRKSPDQLETRETASCANGCGFFGAAASKGMCSKCQEMTAVPPPPPLKKKIKSSVPAVGSSSDAVGTPSSSSASATNQGPAKPATANRCMACRRKVGLTGSFQCRCGGTFCGSHRYADAHGCGFDYKAAGREQIARQNPVVVAAKIAGI